MDPVTVGLTAAGLISKLFGGGGKKVDINKIIARLRAFRPEGYLTDADKAYFERGRVGTMASAVARARLAKAGASRRAIATGTSRSPALARTFRGIDRSVAGEGERAFNEKLNREDSLRLDREGFERQKGLAAFSAELGNAVRVNDQNAAANAAFWNSWGPALKELSGAFLGGPVPSTAISMPTQNIVDETSYLTPKGL